MYERRQLLRYTGARMKERIQELKGLENGSLSTERTEWFMSIEWEWVEIGGWENDGGGSAG